MVDARGLSTPMVFWCGDLSFGSPPITGTSSISVSVSRTVNCQGCAEPSPSAALPIKAKFIMIV